LTDLARDNARDTKGSHLHDVLVLPVVQGTRTPSTSTFIPLQLVLVPCTSSTCTCTDSVQPFCLGSCIMDKTGPGYQTTINFFPSTKKQEEKQHQKPQIETLNDYWLELIGSNFVLPASANIRYK
jgi:hypothetical protein